MTAPVVRVGDRINVAEPDYCYGTGALHLSVTEVGATEARADGPWISLVGTTLHPDGSVLDAEERHALVRLRGLLVVRPSQISFAR